MPRQCTQKVFAKDPDALKSLNVVLSWPLGQDGADASFAQSAHLFFPDAGMQPLEMSSIARTRSFFVQKQGLGRG